MFAHVGRRLLDCGSLQLPTDRGSPVGFKSHRKKCTSVLALVERLDARRLLSSTYYVDANPAIAAHDGGAWVSAYADLQQALTAAIAGDQILVANGTYTPTSTTNRNLSFQLKPGVTLLGGYAGFLATDPDARDPSANRSILSGNIANATLATDNSFHVVNASGTASDAVLDGFTVTAGNANSSTTNGQGGGIYFGSTGNATIRNCSIIGNNGTTGGGFFVSTSASPAMLNCVIASNSATIGGGGQLGSDLSAVGRVNCTIVNNTATNFGSGIDCNITLKSSLANAIVWGNVDPTGNQFHISYNGSLNVTYSDVQGGWQGQGNINGNPNFIQLPDYGADHVWGTADDSFGDLRTTAASPVVDAGSNAAVPASLTLDAHGQTRMIDVPTITDSGMGSGAIVDMGAYEMSPALSANPGGPYTAFFGTDLPLAGRGASSAPGGLRYAWEWTGDGLYDDATGANATFPTNSFAPGTSVNLSLRVTDSSQQTAFAFTTILIARPLIYVDLNATGAGTGFSWKDAFTTLAPALSAAIAGQSIHVAAGTYKPTAATDRNATFLLKDSVDLMGGYAGVAASDPDARNIALNVTTLSGEIGAAGVSDNSFHIVTVNSTSHLGTTLDGFTVSSAGGSAAGGGLTNLNGSVTVQNCTFSSNAATSSGGAIYQETPLAGTIANSMFNGNSSPSGGAVYSLGGTPTITGSTFTTNTATVAGGAIYLSTAKAALNGNSFTNNTSSSNGGAIYNNATDGAFSSCTFTNNTATNFGGGIYNFRPPTRLTVSTCIFTNNHASNASGGGGMFNSSVSPLLVSGCTFSGNTGLGALNNNSSDCTVDRCTFTTNSAGAIYNTFNLIVTQSTFTRNSGSPGGAIYGTVTASYCGFFGNTTFGAGGANYGGGTFNNCIFVGNRAASSGGAIDGVFDAVKAFDCTFSGNTAPTASAISYDSSPGTVRNSIFWGNSTTQSTSSPNSVTFSDLQGVAPSGSNISADPRFALAPSAGPDTIWGTADDNYGDLRLQSDSPAIDVGSNADVPTIVTVDADGDPRIVNVPGVQDPNAIVDMGAYERQLALSADALFLFDQQHALRLAFSSGLVASTLVPGDLKLQNEAGNDIDLSGLALSYDAGTYVALWSFPSPLPDGNFVATLPAGSVTSIKGSASELVSYPSSPSPPTPITIVTSTRQISRHWLKTSASLPPSARATSTPTASSTRSTSTSLPPNSEPISLRRPPLLSRWLKVRRWGCARWGIFLRASRSRTRWMRFQISRAMQVFEARREMAK